MIYIDKKRWIYGLAYAIYMLQTTEANNLFQDQEEIDRDFSQGHLIRGG